jgi:hypothetical protein
VSGISPRAADAGAGAEPGWAAVLGCAGVVLLFTAVPPFLGGPGLLAPIPFPWFVLSMLLSPAAFIVPAAWFVLWAPQLRAGAGEIPRRSVVLLGVLAALTALWDVQAWSYGVRWQGIGYTRAVLACSTGWIVLLAGICVWAVRKPSFAKSCLFHTLLFAWLGWYAFPFLGELP